MPASTDTSGRARRGLPIAATVTVALAAVTLGAAAVRLQAVPAPAATPAAVEAPAATARVVTVTARDYAFLAPDTILAGRTELRLANQGPELHHAQIIRLEDGKTPADLVRAMQAGGPPPAWIKEVGGPNAPAPGQTSTTIVDLEPGTYMFLCFIPSPDGKPHVMKGMMKAFTVVPAPAATPVTPASSDAAGISTRPEPSVTMTLRDYGFDLSSPLTSGRHVIRVRNEAAQAHEVLFARLAPGKTAQDLVAWTEKPEGPPPALPLGGTVGMGRGIANDVVLDLEPGEYALLCFLPDAKDGKPHVAHGMLQQVSVK